MKHPLDCLVKRLGYEAYSHYLRSEHWQVFSSGIRREECFCCGRISRNHHVHHITYERLGKELPQDVISVCNDCHKAIHRLVKGRRCKLRDAHFVVKRNSGKDGEGKPRRKWKGSKWVSCFTKFASSDISYDWYPRTSVDVADILTQWGCLNENEDCLPLVFRWQIARRNGSRIRWNAIRFYQILRIYHNGNPKDWRWYEKIRKEEEWNHFRALLG